MNALKSLLLLCFLVSIGYSQQGMLKGMIRGTGQDGQPVPIEGATVDIYRFDQAQRFTTKTDKKGLYFHSLPAGASTEYAVVISAPQWAPAVSPRFRIIPGEQLEQSFDLLPGDGTRPTFEQVREITAAVPVGASAEEIKKLREQALKEQEEIRRKNEEIRKANAKSSEMKKLFDAGMAANSRKDYEGAVREFKQAALIASELADNTKNQSVIYANLALALYNWGATKFNNKLRDEAKQLFVESAEYADKALQLDPTNNEYRKIYGDACDILARNLGASEYLEKAISAFSSGAEAEVDVAKKAGMLNKLGGLYFSMGDVEKSLVTYDKVLALDPTNVDAMAGKGLVLAASGEKQKMEQAVMLFQQVVETAAPDSKARRDAEENMKYLTETLKIEVGPAKKGTKKGK
ncbi:MAG: hypothetical protein RMM17_12290 [Acidobacteriota bacterium]|nr:hypothetical protein [Blastocatellia bacterium]MDW8413449.1 hypothetical protein [Acidobacteriota bacterium]